MSKERKTATLNMRITPVTKLAIKGIAEREKRSIANVFECLVSDYYGRHAIEMPKITKGGRDARGTKSN